MVEPIELNTLDWQNVFNEEELRNRLQKSYHSVLSLAIIKSYFEALKKEKLAIILESKNISSSYSVKVHVLAVYDRWCLTEQLIYINGTVEKVPYTIQYVDILQGINAKGNQAKLPKIIVEGVNPFD